MTDLKHIIQNRQFIRLFRQSAMPKRHLQKEFMQLHSNSQIAEPLWLTFRDDPADSEYPRHGHAWGEFIYAFNGIMEVHINQIEYLTPPPYGIWLPPNLVHSGINRTDVSHGTLYVHESLCEKLPQQAGILLTPPLVSALFEHLRMSKMQSEQAEYQRLLHVLLDQLHDAPLLKSYLPTSDHPALVKIFYYLQQHLADQSSLNHFAKMVNMSERTLARLCQNEIGMSLNEWRQRLKITKAMSLLAEDKTIENIALDLGYANSSAFINMFKRWMFITPDQFRKSHTTSAN